MYVPDTFDEFASYYKIPYATGRVAEMLLGAKDAEILKEARQRFITVACTDNLQAINWFPKEPCSDRKPAQVKVPWYILSPARRAEYRIGAQMMRKTAELVKMEKGTLRQNPVDVFLEAHRQELDNSLDKAFRTLLLCHNSPELRLEKVTIFIDEAIEARTK